MTTHADRPGWGLIQLTWVSTAVLTGSLVLGVIDPDSFAIVVVVVSLGLFVAGAVAFIWAYFIAVNRSRSDEVSVAGLYLLAEGAPTWARLHLLGALLLQFGLSIAAAAIRPFPPIAFGILAPLLPMGLSGMWAARHAMFRPRMEEQTVMGNTSRRWQNQRDETQKE
jgi:hypothetical protein